MASDRRAPELNERLPRGRHGLPREAVTESQRSRILQAMIEVVSERGYPETRVVDVIEVAGVSRKTFYELFSSKEDCFLATYDVLLGNLLGDTARGFESKPGAPWAERIAAGLGELLKHLAEHPDEARYAIVEVLAAGPKALARRDAALRQFTGFLDARPRRNLGRAARHHLALDRRRHQRAALQRDPARGDGEPAGAAAGPDVLDRAPLPRARARGARSATGSRLTVPRLPRSNRKGGLSAALSPLIRPESWSLRRAPGV